MLVENPILNSPFREPDQYWDFRQGQPVVAQGRRPAGYYLRPRLRGEQASLLEEEFVPLESVNLIRERVRGWRLRGYPGVTALTRQLLQHWTNPDRERRLFFCQIEAAETLMWLVEASPAERQGIEIPGDETLVRYAAKMATGSGKTVVMGMVIAWQVLNKLANPQDRRFSDAVLVVCPNLTIRERLQVLLPWKERNFYTQFNLVPAGLLQRLQQGKFAVTNWHLFTPQDDNRNRSVVKRGVEGDAAFARRVLKDLGGKQHLLVINDEAHHAYRPAPLAEEERASLRPEEVEEREEATVWVEGLERIARARGINFCADFSATPFFIQGSGHDPGTPFPWIVSDFGLVDAIESGITKIPRVPVETNSGALIPEYFRLWEHINRRLPASERQTARRRAKPESVLREAEPALATLANEWHETFVTFRAAGSPVPPALIVVCDNTDLAKLVHDHIATGKVLSEFENRNGELVTFRIDTKLLKEAEAAVEGETREQTAERLRQVVDTIGKLEWAGSGEPPGKRIRCIVSVGMLTEGWDAQNVTQILGLRAFTSQLLCEQVIGRGLRRMNYDDFTEPEYVDVYGVPFEVIPVQKKRVGRTETQQVSVLVRALPERRHLEIIFPRVEGFVLDVRRRIRVNWDDLPALLVTPAEEPTEVIAKAAVGYRVGRPDRLGPGSEVVQDRAVFHREQRLQRTVFEIAAEITHRLKDRRGDWEDRRVLFPQVLEIVWRYVEERVRFAEDLPPEEIGLLKYRQRIVERLTSAIEPDADVGEIPLLPTIEQFRPLGSTSEVLFRTVRPTVGTTKSHISHVVLDAPTWEHSVAYRLERLPEVLAYARNDHLDFAIPYEFQGTRHEYRPDYIVRLARADRKILMLILEVKGFETEQDRAKEVAARRWVRAVNHHGEFGRWEFRVCRNPLRLGSEIRDAAGTASVS